VDQPRVLAVVDDDAAVRRALFRVLCGAGHEVHAFGSAEDFLLDHMQPDCLILDIQLPGMSGLELEAWMRSIGSDVPIVFVTARDDAATRQAVGLTHRPCLSKPFDDGLLLDAISVSLRQ
jgi:FixJ family two-component response regulator